MVELIFIFLNVEPKLSLKGLYAPDPIVGYSCNPNFSGGNHNWFRPYEISINSHGLRGPEFTLDQKNKLRALVLGDSITFGIYVNDDETFCRLLEEKSRKARIPLEVLNGGVDGYWPSNELRWFSSKGVFFKPDIVILVLFVGNDITGEFREVPHLVVHDGLLYPRNHQPNDEEGAYISDLYNWLRVRRIYQFICHKYWTIKKMLDQNKRKEKFIFSKVFEKKGFPREEEAYNRLMTTIKRLAKMCRARDIGFLMVLVPTFEQVYFGELNIIERNKYDIKRPNRKILSLIQSEGIPVLDLLETNDFQVKKDLYLPLERIHLSVEGHKAVARNLYAFLGNKGFLQGSCENAINTKKAIKGNCMNNHEKMIRIENTISLGMLGR